MEFRLTPFVSVNNRSFDTSYCQYSTVPVVIRTRPIVTVPPICIHGYEYVHVPNQGTIPVACNICCPRVLITTQPIHGIPPPPRSGNYSSPYGFNF